MAVFNISIGLQKNKFFMSFLLLCFIVAAGIVLPMQKAQANALSFIMGGFRVAGAVEGVGVAAGGVVAGASIPLVAGAVIGGILVAGCIATSCAQQLNAKFIAPAMDALSQYTSSFFTSVTRGADGLLNFTSNDMAKSFADSYQQFVSAYYNNWILDKSQSQSFFDWSVPLWQMSFTDTATNEFITAYIKGRMTYYGTSYTVDIYKNGVFDRSDAGANGGFFPYGAMYSFKGDKVIIGPGNDYASTINLGTVAATTALTISVNYPDLPFPWHPTTPNTTAKSVTDVLPVSASPTSIALPLAGAVVNGKDVAVIPEVADNPANPGKVKVGWLDGLAVAIAGYIMGTDVFSTDKITTADPPPPSGSPSPEDTPGGTSNTSWWSKLWNTIKNAIIDALKLVWDFLFLFGLNDVIGFFATLFKSVTDKFAVIGQFKDFIYELQRRANE